MHRPRSQDADTRRGFTLIELVVAIVLVAIMAGLVVPRLISGSDRKARAEAESVAELVSVAARRAALATQRIAIDFDEDIGLRVLTLRPRDIASFAWDNMAWSSDPLAPAPVLEVVRVVSATADGQQLPGTRWRIEFAPSERSPEILIGLEDEGGRQWTVALLPESQTAALRQGSPRDVGSISSAVDLDAGGKGDQPW